MSNAVKQDLEHQLEKARRELEIWEQLEANRNDGSLAQDNRFELRGERLAKRVTDLMGQLSALPGS